MIKLRIYYFFIILYLLISVFINSGVHGQTKNSDLSFGDFYPSTSGGYVEITTDGSLNTLGVIHLGGTISAAEFSVRSTGKSRTITITSLVEEIQINRVGGGGNMTLHIGPIEPNSYVHTGGNKNWNVRIGGRLVVGNMTSNPPGSYSGTFTIIFNNL